jgi:hypothetical protein
VRDVARLGLQQEQQVAVFLRLFVVREGALLDLGAALEMAGNFFALLPLE